MLIEADGGGGGGKCAGKVVVVAVVVASWRAFLKNGFIDGNLGWRNGSGGGSTVLLISNLPKCWCWCGLMALWI